MQTTTTKLVLEPVAEILSDLIYTPKKDSRWKNGKLSICGRVVAIGPQVQDVKVGDYAYHSDSCYAPINGGKFNVIRQNDIMFLTDELIPAKWIGAEENFDA